MVVCSPCGPCPAPCPQCPPGFQMEERRLKVPVGNPVLLAPMMPPKPPSCCLPPPVVPLVPNVVGLSIGCPPRMSPGVPSFVPPLPPCVPISPMRMAAMPLSKSYPVSSFGCTCPQYCPFMPN